MNKNKSKKHTTNFLDIITLQNLKWIIVICFILSVLCEFLPSIFNICELFNYNSFVVFLQPHKDFFTNIVLGCLASAVVSYIMLLIPRRIKAQEEKGEILLYQKSVINHFLALYFYLKRLTKSENTEEVKVFINFLKSEKDYLYRSIMDLINCYERIGNVHKYDDFINICQEKLLLLIKEIENFLYVYVSLEDAHTNWTFSIEASNEMFKFLYDRLDRNYKLEKMKEDFKSKISVPLEFIPIDLITDKKKMSENLLKLREEIDKNRQVKYYSSEIVSIYQKYLQEDM